MADQAPRGRLQHRQAQAVAEAWRAGVDRGRHLGQQLRWQQAAAQQGPEEPLQAAKIGGQVARAPGQRGMVDSEVQQQASLIDERQAVATRIRSRDG